MRHRAGLAVTLAAVTLAVISAPRAEDDPFPLPHGLEDAVVFWERAFAEWDVDQVAVHDMDHLSIVYEVVPLAGPREFPYTDEQREYVDGVREAWEQRLAALESKIERSEPLSAEEKALALKITTLAGSEAVTGASERVRTQRGLRSRFRRSLERSALYLESFRAILRDAGVPEDLAYLPHVESSFDPTARSSAGARGMWQFTRGTGRLYLRINHVLDERLDPWASTRAAARYLRHAYETLESWPLAVTSYNHGVQGMRRARDRFGDDLVTIVREYDHRAFGFASRNFYAEFLAARRIARQPEVYFPEGIRPEPAEARQVVFLEHPTSPGALARRYGVPLDELASLNPWWRPHAVQRGHRLPTGSRVVLPAGAVAREVQERPDVFHTVRRGETLSTIAQRYGLSTDELRRLNGLGPRADLIHAGQKLRVRAQDGVVHVVRRGETLTRIASVYRVPLRDLLTANGLSVRSVIFPGQTLQIP